MMTAANSEADDERSPERQALRDEPVERAHQRQAASSTIAPCAKLNTPDALKISTKPSATSE